MKKFTSVALLVLAAASALAVVLPMTVAELSAQAQTVAAVEVVSVNAGTVSTPRGNLSCLLYRARLLRALAGAPAAEFLVRSPGRIEKGKIVTPADAPPLVVGGRFVLFLKTPADHAPRTFEVVGLSEGALPLIEGPGREPLVITPVAGRPVLVRLNDLAATVSAARLNPGAKP